MEENKESPSTTEHGECCEECKKTCKRHFWTEVLHTFVKIATPGKPFTMMESLSGVLDNEL